jgi:hypothetical protein
MRILWPQFAHEWLTPLRKHIACACPRVGIVDHCPRET